MSSQWNSQLIRYDSKAIKCLEQNTRKQIDCKKPSNTQQLNRLKYIQIEIWKEKLLGNTKHNKAKLVLPVSVSAKNGIKLYYASLIKLVR